MEEAVSHFHPEMNRGERPNEKRQYYAWFVVRATIEVKCSSGFRLHCRDRNGGMGATLPSATVVQLVEWINLLPADGVPVTALMLMRQALESYRGTVLHFLVVATDHQLDPESITCYYEAALIAAIRHQLPNVAINGCLFHWKQEIRRRMKKPRLHDAQAGFAMECGAIDMLTVIPVTQVAISASHTSSSTFSIAATRNMSCTPRPSGPHFDRTWVHTYLVELWNVHVIPHAVINRTNIPRERFNRELNAPPTRACRSLSRQSSRSPVNTCSSSAMSWLIVPGPLAMQLMSFPWRCVSRSAVRRNLIHSIFAPPLATN
ncbi:hypothetical protein PF008_g11997 [Phytophthora fragariae]|uniref:MULE transposase domain-containing protein n=1 Tax=Phytophthora fragariae TaxID=53985 RepID=A0A6G0RP28_9STRA|nr:hypothetical protein PF008_g11997 [Phytophthora fragariae]